MYYSPSSLQQASASGTPNGSPVFTPFPSNARPGNELQGANALGEGEFSAEKPKSPAEVENGTYFGMYTMPEAQQLKEKQLRLNTKFPDSLAASRLVRVVGFFISFLCFSY